MQATVQGQAGNLHVTVGSQTIPLGNQPTLSAGQAVLIEIVQTASGKQVQISPVQSATTPPPPAAPPIAAGVQQAAQSLGLPNAIDHVAALVPQRVAGQGIDPIRNLLQFLARPQGFGEDLAQLRTIIAQAVAAGVSDGIGELDVLAMATRAVGSDASLREVLNQVAREGGFRLEGQLSAAVRSGGDPAALLADSLRGKLAALQRSESFTTFLRGEGVLEQFTQTADRLLTRVTSAQLQSLHGVDQPYWFYDIPFDPGSAFNTARFHVFGERRGGSRRDPHAGSVVMDLSLTQLGDLWVNVTAATGRCACTVRATNLDGG